MIKILLILTLSRSLGFCYFMSINTLTPSIAIFLDRTDFFQFVKVHSGVSNTGKQIKKEFPQVVGLRLKIQMITPNHITGICEHIQIIEPLFSTSVRMLENVSIVQI